jgi:hypothetical protein
LENTLFRIKKINSNIIFKLDKEFKYDRIASMDRVFLRKTSTSDDAYRIFETYTLFLNLEFKFGTILGFNRMQLFGHDNLILNQAKERLDKEV